MTLGKLVIKWPESRSNALGTFTNPPKRLEEAYLDQNWADNFLSKNPLLTRLIIWKYFMNYVFDELIAT